MAVIDRILKPFGLQRSVNLEKRSTSNLVNPKSWLMTGGFGGVKGMNVTRDTAMSISAVYRAVDILSGVVASIPFYVYRKEQENRIIETNHIISQRFNRKACSYMNGYDFKRTLVVHLLMDGNAYVHLMDNGEYKLLDYRCVMPFLFQGQKYYRITDGSSQVLLDSQVMHFKGISFGADGFSESTYSYSTGLKGLSPITATYGTHSGALAESYFSNKFFENGANPSGVVEHPDTLSDTGYNNLKTSANAAYGGLDNTGRLIVLEQGAKFKQITINPKDAMLIEKKKLTVDDIARVYGVPPHLLYNLERATYNSVENLSTEFVKYSIKPRIEAIENEIELKYFDTDMSMQVRADLDSLLRGDSNARAELYRTLFNTGAMSPNEIRQREGANPYDGGDQRFVQVNMMVMKPDMKNPTQQERMEMIERMMMFEEKKKPQS